MSEENLHRKSVKQNHNFDSWAGKILQDEYEFIRKFTLYRDSMSKFVVEVPEQTPTVPNEKESKTYIIRDKNSEDQAYVTISETRSIIDAHESIIDYLMSCMAPKFPTGSERNLIVGDICFVGLEESVKFAVFSRANLMVIVDGTSSKKIDVRQLVRNIDELIMSRPEPASIFSTFIKKFRLEKDATKKGDAIKVEVLTDQDLIVSPTLRLFTNAGEIFETEEDLLTIKCDKIGIHKVELFVTDDRGQTATKTVNLNVL